MIARAVNRQVGLETFADDSCKLDLFGSADPPSVVTAFVSVVVSAPFPPALLSPSAPVEGELGVENVVKLSVNPVDELDVENGDVLSIDPVDKLGVEIVEELSDDPVE